MNCRDDNMCVFCKHWIGGEPNVNYLTGDCRDRIKDGLCAKDSSEKKQRAKPTKQNNRKEKHTERNTPDTTVFSGIVKCHVYR